MWNPETKKVEFTIPPAKRYETPSQFNDCKAWVNVCVGVLGLGHDYEQFSLASNNCDENNSHLLCTTLAEIDREGVMGT
jgi:hypothetical protein